MPRARLNDLELCQVIIRLARNVADVQCGLPDQDWTPEWTSAYPAFRAGEGERG